ILQITNTIISELKFENHFDEKRIVNLSDKPFSGIVEIKTSKTLEGYEKYDEEMGFDEYLLTDTQQVPITEDYTSIKTYLTPIKKLKPDEVDFVIPQLTDGELEVSDNNIKNENIELKIFDGNIFINDIQFSLIDFADLGDSYNNAPDIDDKGYNYKVIRSRIAYKGYNRCSLRIEFEGKWDIIPLVVSLNRNSNYLKFEFNWDNSKKNHLLEAQFILSKNIKTVYSEDMDTLIKRKFDSNYDIRENLPKERGIEVKTNTAPMQRGLLIDEKENNLGVITKGLTQYEIYKNNLYIPILRSTGVISNPKNPARTTPAGPPLETPELQMLWKNKAEFYVFFGNQNAFKNVINSVYNYIVV
ncbi:MAG: hypothetical protein MJ231_04320, partial [bacterium]|nr:hypothetical protein [bacterium]